MPINGLDQVRRALAKEAMEIAQKKSRKAVTEVLITAAGFAATMTPIDTSNLINSQFREVSVDGEVVTGMLGYTAAYAAAVHDAKGTLLGKNVLRYKNDPSRGVVWAPDGEPEFLRKSFEAPDAVASIKQIVDRNMKI